MEWEAFPGNELMQEGVSDLRGGVESVPSLLVSIGAPRLRRSGFPVPEAVLPSPELRLYQKLRQSNPDGAHSQYNALIRRLTSFERALECAG